MTTPGRPRARLLGLISAAVLVCAAGTFTAFYVAYHRPIGHPPTGATLPPECQISEALRQEARVSNPMLMQEPDPSRRELVRHTHCFWRQTLGKEQGDRRILGIHVYDHAEFTDATGAAAETYKDQQQPNHRRVPGLGDEASVADRMPDNNREITLLVLRGARVYKVIYRGSDRGFFVDRPLAVEEGERVARKVVEELTEETK